MKTALIVIDIQSDFCPGGALGVRALPVNHVAYDVALDFQAFEKGLALRSFGGYGARRFWAARTGGDD